LQVEACIAGYQQFKRCMGLLLELRRQEQTGGGGGDGPARHWHLFADASILGGRLPSPPPTPPGGRALVPPPQRGCQCAAVPERLVQAWCRAAPYAALCLPEPAGPPAAARQHPAQAAGRAGRLPQPAPTVEGGAGGLVGSAPPAARAASHRTCLPLPAARAGLADYIEGALLGRPSLFDLGPTQQERRLAQKRLQQLVDVLR
jgi:hypothetical protein